MSAVPRAAVDAVAAQWAIHGRRDYGECTCGHPVSGKWSEHIDAAIAAAVVAAAQGPIKAEALREAADSIGSYSGSLEVVTVRRSLRDRADRIEETA